MKTTKDTKTRIVATAVCDRRPLCTKGTEHKAGQRTAAVLAFVYLGEAQRSIDAAARMGAFTDQEVYWLGDLGQRLGRLRAETDQRFKVTYHEGHEEHEDRKL